MVLGWWFLVFGFSFLVGLSGQARLRQRKTEN